MKNKGDLLYLIHLLQAISKIEQYIKSFTYAQFCEDELVQDAVIRQLQIIGEATKNLSADFKKRYQTVPWRDIAGMPDKLIHDYFGVDIDAVWKPYPTISSF